MSYNLHITHSRDYSNSELAPLTMDEWEAVVAADPELERGPDGAGQHGEVLPGSACYLYRTHGLGPWPIWWHRGRVYARNPDYQMIWKMLHVARKLGARVQGDDLECYALDDWDCVFALDPETGERTYLKR